MARVRRGRFGGQLAQGRCLASRPLWLAWRGASRWTWELDRGAPSLALERGECTGGAVAAAMRRQRDAEGRVRRSGFGSHSDQLDSCVWRFSRALTTDPCAAGPITPCLLFGVTVFPYIAVFAGQGRGRAWTWVCVPELCSTSPCWGEKDCLGKRITPDLG